MSPSSLFYFAESSAISLKLQDSARALFMFFFVFSSTVFFSLGLLNHYRGRISLVKHMSFLHLLITIYFILGSLSYYRRGISLVKRIKFLIFFYYPFTLFSVKPLPWTYFLSQTHEVPTSFHYPFTLFSVR